MWSARACDALGWEAVSAVAEVGSPSVGRPIDRARMPLCAANRYEVYLVALHHIQIGTFAGYDGMYWISISGAPPPPFVATLQITLQSSLARTSYRMLLVFFPAATCRRSACDAL